MYKRLELHNHTTESDGSLTPAALIDFLQKDRVDAFAITDHNTISGHAKIKELLIGNSDISCIYGMEYTTYYGHILCFQLSEYVPWENINRHKPELLFAAAREKGALVGVAHPFSYGNPFARGCRFDMEIQDFHSFDFIEIFNNLEPLHEVNERGLNWWEELVLKGYPLAFTCGMDLHGSWDMSNHYATYIKGVKEGDIGAELVSSIKHQQTWISRGPLLVAHTDHQRELITFDITATNKTGYVHEESDPYFLTLKTKKGILTKEISVRIPTVITFQELEQEATLLPKLYHKDTCIENLICVAPTISL